MPPAPLAAATNLVPSPEEASDCQLRLGLWPDQVAPESVEVKICPPLTAATSFLPSTDEATAFQLRVRSRGVQLNPIVSIRLPTRMDWPAFCATIQPPAPLPATRTVSPTRSEAGNVTTTGARSLVAR